MIVITRCGTLNWLRFAFVLTIALLGVQPTLASVELRQALSELAGDVKQVLDGKGANELAIGKFDGPPSHKTAAGPGFTMILQEELVKKGIAVREQSKLGIEGRYSLTEVPATNPDDARIGKKVLAIKVKLEIVDAFDNRDMVNFERKVLNGQGKGDERIVRGEATLARTFGGNTPLNPHDTEVENDLKLRQKIISAQVVISKRHAFKAPKDSHMPSKF